MVTIAEKFNLRVGYSDHSAGSVASTVAVSLGATVIEKHFTLDKALEGPDHAASLDADELVEFINTLQNVGVVLGSSEKAAHPDEASNRAAVRRSLVAASDIVQGQIIDARQIDCRRPAVGRTSFEFWDVVGSVASRSYSAGDYLD
jgi:N-acetylneuraminate synthase